MAEELRSKRDRKAEGDTGTSPPLNYVYFPASSSHAQDLHTVATHGAHSGLLLAPDRATFDLPRSGARSGNCSPVEYPVVQAATFTISHSCTQRAGSLIGKLIQAIRAVV